MLGAHRVLLEAYESDVRPLLGATAPAWSSTPTRSPPSAPQATPSGSPPSAGHGVGRERLRAALTSERPECGSRSSSPASATRSSPTRHARRSACSSASGTRSSSRGADVLRPDAPEQRLRATRRGCRRRFEPIFANSTRSSHRRRRVSAPCASCTGWRTSSSSPSFSSPAGRRRRRCVVRGPRHVPPDVPFAARHPSRRRTAPVAAERARPRAGRASESRRVLRLRRDVRDQERGDVERDARRQVRRDRRDASGGLHGRRRLVPAPDRRRSFTSRSARARGASRGDPRVG